MSKHILKKQNKTYKKNKQTNKQTYQKQNKTFF